MSCLLPQGMHLFADNVEESVTAMDVNEGFWATTSHRGAQATIEFEYGQVFCCPFSDDIQGVWEALKRDDVALFQSRNFRFGDPVFILNKVGGHHLAEVPNEEVWAIIEAEFLDVGRQMVGQCLFLNIRKRQLFPPSQIMFAERGVADEVSKHGDINSIHLSKNKTGIKRAIALLIPVFLEKPPRDWFFLANCGLTHNLP